MKSAQFVTFRVPTPDELGVAWVEDDDVPAPVRASLLVAEAVDQGLIHTVYVPTWEELGRSEPDGEGNAYIGDVVYVGEPGPVNGDKWWIGTIDGEEWLTTGDEAEARWFVAVLKAIEAGL